MESTDQTEASEGVPSDEPSPILEESSEFKIPSITDISERFALPPDFEEDDEDEGEDITAPPVKLLSNTSQTTKSSDDKQIDKGEIRPTEVTALFESSDHEIADKTSTSTKSQEEEDMGATKDQIVPAKLWDAVDDDQSLWDAELKFPETDDEVKHAKNLFTTIMDSERIKLMQFPSMLISGFGLRNYPSLCRALQYQQQLDEDYKQRKQKEEDEEIARLKKYRELARDHHGEYRGESGMSFSNLGSQTDVSTMSASTHGDTTAEQRRRIQYLMGLDGTEGEEGLSAVSMIGELKDDESCGPEKEEPLTGTSESMRQAQQYLQTHHIFELFQFIIVHLLSKVPENPIQFIIVLLDKLLIYRTGLGMPPLHYKKRHLEQLFFLMDRMRTGYIDVQQYKTGMNTIGIKCFNNQPTLSDDGQVSKEVFVEEAYQCSSYVLNKIIKERKIQRNSRK